MTNPLGASIPYSLRAPRNREENRKHCVTILEIQSTSRQHVVLVSKGHGETRRCTQQVSQKTTGLKYFYTNREVHNSVGQRSKETPTARTSRPAQSSTAHTHKLWTGFSVFWTIKLVPSSRRTARLRKSTAEMCKIKTTMKTKSKERLFTVSATTRTKKHKLKHLFTSRIIKLQTHNHRKLWIQKGLDKLTANRGKLLSHLRQLSRWYFSFKSHY